VIARLRAFFVKKDFTTESVDLNEATREVIALSLNELQRDRVVLQLELADDLPPVTGDRVQLQQVILNLLLNASESMSAIDDRPRRLVLRTERDEGNRVRLAMRDEGVGLEPRDLDRVFDPFYSTKSGGMGIGLSVSRSIIENHHGRLWAAPNEGPWRHVFIFYSALARGCDRRAEPWRQLDPGSDRCGARHEEFLMVVRSLLQGNRCVRAPTKTEASPAEGFHRLHHRVAELKCEPSNRYQSIRCILSRVAHARTMSDRQRVPG